MKKLILTVMAVFFTAGFASAQRFAYVDTEYILSNIPAYKSAQEQILTASDQWQKEVDEAFKSIEALYKGYQEQRTSMNASDQRKKEDEIIAKENEAKELQKKYFGREGLLPQMQEEFLKPIRESVLSAVKAMSAEEDYSIVFDTASDAGILYFNPKNDKSDEILQRMGYK